MASTIPDFLTRYLPRMEFIDIHYVLVGVERFELSIPKARDFKSLAYTNSATRPFLTFYIYYTSKFSESQNFNVSLWQNTQSTNALFVGILNVGSRAPYIPFRIHGSFLLRNEKPQITEDLFRISTGYIIQALPSYLLRCTCRRTLRPAICT